jgi:hypothetical protein
MKMAMDYIKRISSSEKYWPVAFFIITFLCFGLLAKRLGFYQDDWPYIFYAFNKGIPSLKDELYYDNRPNAAWLYIGLFKLLGVGPLAWHYATAFFRWATATSLWYLLKRIWPGHTREVTLTTLIFLVHPFFLIQPYAVNSILYWSGYFFFACSLLIMAKSVTAKKYRVPLTILAVILEGLHLFTNEYFVGMTLLRPLILFWLVSAQDEKFSVRVRRVLLHWLPYLAMLVSYIVWRIFLFVPPFGRDRNAPVILYGLFESPQTTIPYLIRTVLQDSLIITFTSWYRTLVPELLGFASIFNWFVILVILIAFAVCFFYLRGSLPMVSTSNTPWFGAPLLFGCLVILLGMAPIWMIGQDIVTHQNQFAGSRFGIGAIFGAAMILTVILENLIDQPGKKMAVVSIFMALAVSMHLSDQNKFAYSWEKQERFSQQLLWRAPEIEPGTAIFTDEEILGYMGEYAVSFSIITAYQPGDVQTAPYWYFPFYYTYPDIDSLISGIPLNGRRVGITFSGNSNKMLLLSFNPEMQRCLWVLSPQDANLHLVSEDMRRLSVASDMTLIKQGEGIRQLPESIYGPQTQDTWCYYFEKADLARQFGQWDTIVGLLEEAEAQGERADNGFEYIPFIEAYGHLENWEQVRFLTRAANRITSGLEPSLCSTMDRLATAAPTSQLRNDTVRAIKEDLKCIDYQ